MNFNLFKIYIKSIFLIFNCKKKISIFCLYLFKIYSKPYYLKIILYNFNIIKNNIFLNKKYIIYFHFIFFYYKLIKFNR